MAMVTKKMTNTDVREDIKEAFKVFDTKGVGSLTYVHLHDCVAAVVTMLTTLNDFKQRPYYCLLY